MKIKKRYFIIPLIAIFGFAVSLFCLGVYLRLWENVERIRERIERNSRIRSVEITEDEGLFLSCLYLKITLADGGKLYFAHVSSYLTCIYLISIGEYTCREYIFNHNYRHYSMDLVHIKLLEKILEIPLNTINDVIENYDTIYRYISALPDKNSPEYEDIKHEDYNRFFDPDMKLNIIEWSGESYILFKSNTEENDQRREEEL